MRVLAAVVIGAFVFSGCSGGGSVAPTPIAQVVAPQGHTMRVLDVAKDTAQIVIDGAVVDTIVHTEDGSAEHTFSDGRIVADRPPIAKVGELHTEAHICRVLPDATAVEAYRRSTVAYNTATGMLILAVGATAAADVVSGGLATFLLVGSVGVTYYAWVDARNNMYADHAALAAQYVTC